MKDFEPRPFQKEVLDRIKSEVKVPPMLWPPRANRTYYGVDIGEKDGDHTVISRVETNGRGGILSVVFDEYNSLPDYKWYRNPIKWWEWRRFWHRIAKRNGKYPYGRAK